MALAERKYDLALVATVTDKKIRPQPWYKERLKTKYIKSLKPSDRSKNLIGKNWLFVKDGLDDFRDGVPPAVDGNILISPEKGPGPTISASDSNVSPVKQPAMTQRFDKNQICYSRITPQQLERRQHIDEIEHGLLRHPLALYPHLEESVPPELFEDIVDILDPEMTLESSDESSEESSDHAIHVEDESEMKKTERQDEVAKEQKPVLGSAHASRLNLDAEKKEEEADEEPIRNLYRWLPRKEEKKEKKKTSEKRSQSPSQEKHIENVTKEFCEWVASLGGESNNIEESTITSLFASGYETKPALSVPIHVVELTNVPQELRMSATAPQQQPETSKKEQKHCQKKKRWEYSGKYEPSWVKFKYGAWYLKPKLWQKRDYDVPLVDPKELKNQEMSETKKRSHNLNIELSQMHGSKAFMEFIEKKQTRKPEFLEQVSEIQKQQEEEERLKLEAEMAVKQKRTSVNQPSAKTKSK